MNTDTSDKEPGWIDQLLADIGTVQREFTRLEGELAADTVEDFSHLLEAAVRLEHLRGTAEQPANTHDLMNILTALRGYAEMLREDVGEGHPPLDTGLSALLATVQTAHSGRDDGAHVASAVPPSEPGFILAVDDLQENRELVARSLSRMGHMVITAASGEEALQALEQSDVDVVLLDLLMPGLDGREVLRRIKEHPEWRATPVIVISGNQDMDGIIECIESGADDYLFKPFNPVLLQARIKAGIERKRWHDREEQYRQQLERNEKFIRATFGRYLSDEIVTDILERPEGLELGGDLRRVSIMMSDIRGFTTLSENLAPSQVVTLLNRYLGTMTDIILEHRGTIDEFIGDAILAVFGAPQRGDDDEDRAVRCALAMQEAMVEINALNEAEGFPSLNTGIAINTGDVIAGNIGSERRSKYGFVGHAMNVTSRIEDHAAGGEILIADSTLKALEGRYALGRSQEINVRGIDEALVIHQVTGALEMNATGTVLLVEDNELNRDMMVRRLKRAGMEVLTAGNGQQALDIMRAEHPGVVLMDMNLPILDGWAASRRAKEDERISHIPIIALTAHATEDHKAYALEAGCDDYATKPVDFPGLLIKIQKLIRA